MKVLSRMLTFILPATFVFYACEGPRGETGKAGEDVNETCKQCHNSKVVQAKASEFELSKHSWGEAAFEEAGNTGCTPCHASEAFKYVVHNNVPATFTKGSNNKYTNNYATTASTAIGMFNCFTCHDSLHTSYTYDDFYPLITTAAVPMTMWKGAKTIDLKQDAGISNLCVKCHQPRPLTKSNTISDADVVDYAALISSPTAVFYNSVTGNAAPNTVVPSYRTHVHYGTVGAIFAGVGGIEFPGSLAYTSSKHTTEASCSDCHMATISGRAGGHTFNASTNLNGCNVTGCHTPALVASTPATGSYATYWANPRTEIKTLLNTLATRINAVGGGTPILHSEADPEANLWAGRTTGNFDGYLNIYDPSTNPNGVWKNPGAPLITSSSRWTDAQYATNNALPTFPTLLNVQMGAMINFQMVLREYSLGIHNFDYTKALLQNTLDAMTTAGV